MEQPEKLLKDYSDAEKAAYLAAIASIATADRQASEAESEFLDALSDSAELPEAYRETVTRAAGDVSGIELKNNLNILKGSDLKYSLITDLIAFAESDENYSAEEKASIEEIARYLDINQQQFSALNQFVQKTSAAGVSAEQAQQQGFLGSLGLEDKFKNAGLNMNTITKGLLGVIGPILLSKILSRGSGGRSRRGGGLDDMLGGMLGGRGGSGGGLGSLISMLNGGRGMGSTGGLFGKLLRGGF